MIHFSRLLDFFPEKSFIDGFSRLEDLLCLLLIPLLLN